MLADAVLWNGLKKGDREKFLTLYQRYYHRLLFIGIREIKDPQLVKDVIQQQFLYLWEKRETLREAKSVQAYLVSSFMRRLSTDWKEAGNNKLSVISEIENCICEQDTPEERLIQKEQDLQLTTLLLRHIGALPPRQRELMIFKFYNGFSYEEIVKKTGLSHRTVYNKIHEGLKKIRMDFESEKSQTGILAYLSALLLIAGHYSFL